MIADSHEKASYHQKYLLLVTKDEFYKILSAIETASPIVFLGGRGEKKNMFKPNLETGFKLFLLTGGRREEVVDLRWSDIMQTVKGGVFSALIT